MLVPTEEIINAHYAEHLEKKFFPGLKAFFLSGPLVAMCWEGKKVIEVSRLMMGKTNPCEADPSTVRGMYAIDIGRNIIHGSDGEESAKREIGIWFKEEELCNWTKTADSHIYE